MACLETLDEFCKRAYANHDAAHNDDHGKRVLEYAKEIIERDDMHLLASEWIELPYVMRCHDVRDDKAVRNGVTLSEEEVTKFYMTHLGIYSTARVIFIHNNCSWSKRKESQPLPEDTLRLLLQDADWLEALGDIGLTRCIEYTKFVNPNANDNEITSKVCRHIREKLLLIPNELNYETSREIVQECRLLEPLLKYLQLYEKK